MRTTIIGHTAENSSPVEGNAFILTEAQVDYLRELVLDDLHDFAEMLAANAKRASETSGRAVSALDVQFNVSQLTPEHQERPIVSTLNVLGWVHEDVIEAHAAEERGED